MSSELTERLRDLWTLFRIQPLTALFLTLSVWALASGLMRPDSSSFFSYMFIGVVFLFYFAFFTVRALVLFD